MVRVASAQELAGRSPSTMAPWRLDPLVAERLEKNRQQLVEAGGPHEGSADMRNNVEYADAIIAYHELAFDRNGRPLPSLTHGQRIQLCVCFCKAISRHPLISLGIDPRADHLLGMAGPLLPVDEPCGAMLSLATQVAAVCAPFPSHDYELKVQKTEQLEHIVRMCPEAAQGLPDWLRKQGSAHTITVLELRRLAHYRVVKAAMGLMEEARAAGRPLPPPLLRQAKQSAAALVALAPDWPRYLLLQAEVFSAADDLKTAAAINRRVIEAATAQNAHYWAAQGAINLALFLMSGAEGPTFELAAVNKLLDDAEREYKLSRAWAAASYKRSIADVKEAREDLKHMMAADPRGATRLKADWGGGWGGAAVKSSGSECAWCHENVIEVKKCSACKAVAYCSRECQVAHWKQGGHKTECANLAAQQKQKA